MKVAGNRTCCHEERFWMGHSYGWRKCSKSHARRMETDLSGSPLWGLQALGWIIPNCCKALCWRIWWSTNLSLAPLLLASPKQSSSPKLLLAVRIWLVIASLRHRNCFDIVCSARAVYVLADPIPAAFSNQEITICIWLWYCLYLCSTLRKGQQMRQKDDWC